MSLIDAKSNSQNPSLKYKLILMSFLQFIVWGSWLITIANYWFETKQWGPVQFGAIFSTLGLSSLFMPTLMGIVADRWINAEKLFGILHLLGGSVLLFLPQVSDPDSFYWWIFLSMIFYMPTIALSNSIGYNVLKSNNFNVVKDFPPIRVWGTIGFIVAMWFTNLTGNKTSSVQFYIGGISELFLAIYAFTLLPKCPTNNLTEDRKSITSAFGIDAFRLFGQYKMALFFLFSMLLGASLQLTNMYGDLYISEFKNVPKYADLWVVEHSTIIMSISQISETVFILAIPFFLRRFGIKKVMLISMFAWVFRFALLALGNPADGLWMIIVSCIVYGMAFDFFNISGSLFVETNTNSKIRSSAQGLFMMMTNGFGAVMGSYLSGVLIKNYFTLPNGTNDWYNIWLSFAAYSLVVAILFGILFKHDHKPVELDHINH